MSRFLVTWPAQVAANKPPEEYASRSRADVRVKELHATGSPLACWYEVEDEGMSA